MTGWRGVAGTLATVFIVAVLSQWIALGGDIFATGWDGVKTCLSAGALAVAAAVVAALNPADKRYGIGAEKDLL